ncbi:serpin family protein [Brachybacterium sp. UNK5269]|uniref:serpin family protein n=1 Tax=Brachybacterium sp. UNK5269 TaxID=3408576 RepID=UPI003BB168EB
MTTDAPRLRRALRRRPLLGAGALLPLAALGVTGCGRLGAGGGAEPDLRAELPRAEPEPAEGAGALVVPFTARLLGAIDRTPVNAVCSPLSAQVALTMIGMGAAGDTRAQLEDVLGGSMDELASTANTLSTALSAVGDQEREADVAEAPEPAVASLVNGTWIQEGLEVQQPYLEDLATWFGSGLFEADFVDAGEREAARERINDWVAESTNDLIEELVPPDILSTDTRLVLVSALHLKAAWSEPLTALGGSFTTTQGEERSCEMLTGIARTWYEDETCRATSLDTYGDALALALVQPTADVGEVLDAWTQAADDARGGLAALLSGLEAGEASVQLTVPALDIGWEDSLRGVLEELGMPVAFTDHADFSGVTRQEPLYLREVLQKAVLMIDEEGMEAAAATAVVADTESAEIPEQELLLDSPFLVVAYERSTRAPLVVGWVGDPTQTR